MTWPAIAYERNRFDGGCIWIPASKDSNTGPIRRYIVATELNANVQWQRHWHCRSYQPQLNGAFWKATLNDIRE
jgi:hypothetical protein